MCLYIEYNGGENRHEENKKRILALLFIGLGVLQPFFIVYGEEESPVSEVGNLYALSAVLMDGDSGRILYEKNAGEKRAMASTTKIMTCILILENGNPEDKAVTSAYAASMPKVHLGAVKGEEFYVKDLLYSLMLESHNDAAVILAEYAAGSVPKFAEMMNEKAAKLGCKDTWFITPNGLDAQEEKDGEVKKHATTAADLAKIMRYCIEQSPQKEKFLKITGTQSYRFSDVAGKREFSCVNHNAFLSMMEGAISGKTGFTGDAGYCYTGALRRDGRTFIVALLGCGWPNHKSYKWNDTRRLMEYGLKEYEIRSLSEGAVFKIPERIRVKNGQNPCLGQDAAAKTVWLKGEDTGLLLRKDEKTEVRYQGAEELEAPVKAGTKIGEVLYLVQGKVWKKEEVVTAQEVKKIDFPWCFKQAAKRLLVEDEARRKD